MNVLFWVKWDHEDNHLVISKGTNGNVRLKDNASSFGQLVLVILGDGLIMNLNPLSMHINTLLAKL